MVAVCDSFISIMTDLIKRSSPVLTVSIITTIDMIVRKCQQVQMFFADHHDSGPDQYQQDLLQSNRYHQQPIYPLHVCFKK